jgi:hypothetical protein
MPSFPTLRRLSLRPLRRLPLAAALLPLVTGCSMEPADSVALREVSWPYARIAADPQVPPELTGQPMFSGRWLAADPAGGDAIAESSDPRYLLRLPFGNPRRFSFLDLGPDAEIETLGFLEGGKILLLVGVVTTPERSRAAASRALLQFDVEQSLLLDSIPLPRDRVARGFAVDPVTRRVYLFQDDGAGNGSVQVVDLYGGVRHRGVPMGVIPAGVGRKGLAMGRNGRMLYCLTGGESSRSDFEPVQNQPPSGPELLLLDPDTLGVTARIPLDDDAAPRAVISDPDRDLAFVLANRGSGSRLYVIDTGFAEIRGTVDVANEGSDLALTQDHVIVACARGIYFIDPTLDQVVGGVQLPFGRTGDMAVSGDGLRALVQFEMSPSGGGSGIALASLNPPGLADVLQ